MKHKKRYDKSVYRSLVFITQFGINMLVPICMMTALGIFLDNKFGTSFWMILLFFIGAIAGGQNIYRMAKKIYSEPARRDSAVVRDRAKEQNSKNANHRELESKK